MIDIQKDTAVEGEEIEVNCTAMASKPATTIRWFKGNKELKGEMQIARYPGSRSTLDPSRSISFRKLKTNGKHTPQQKYSFRYGS